LKRCGVRDVFARGACVDIRLPFPDNFDGGQSALLPASLGFVQALNQLLAQAGSTKKK
jgi:hypothetical protein